MTKKKSGDDEVGYGKPPKQTRFKPGESGNPKGRPKKAKAGPPDVAEILSEEIAVKNAGVSRKMRPFEAGVRQLVSQALNDKKLDATLEFVRLCEKHGIVAPAPDRKVSGGVLVIPKTWVKDEWMQMFHEHGEPPWPGDRTGLVE